MQLRPHQEKAVKAMLRNSKGQVIVPTGGGKTMCMIEDLKREIDKSLGLQVIPHRTPSSYNLRVTV